MCRLDLYVTAENLHWYWYFPTNAPYHIHRGLTIQDRTYEILPAKPYIDYHALADRAVFMQDSPHKARIIQAESYQYDNWFPSVANKEFGYQYHWERVVGYIKMYQCYAPLQRN